MLTDEKKKKEKEKKRVRWKYRLKNWIEEVTDEQKKKKNRIRNNGRKKQIKWRKWQKPTHFFNTRGGHFCPK